MEYFISKLIKNDDGLINTVNLFSFDGQNLNDLGTENRTKLVQLKNSFNKISTIYKSSDGEWQRGAEINYSNNLFSWDRQLPLNITRRKTFISYYHKEDQYYKENFKALFGDLISHKSVEDGDIDPDNSDDYIKQLIQKGFLADTTVLVVLIGPNTKHRMHIDWEISGALDPRVGDKCAGILGLKLPSHPYFGTGKHNYNLLPDRIADNLKSGYAIIRDWTEDRIKMQEYIELAFDKRDTNYNDRDNSRLQMKENTN